MPQHVSTSNVRSTSYFVQVGNSSTLRLGENFVGVVYEEWQGSRLLDTGIVSRHASEAEAREAVKQYKNG